MSSRTQLVRHPSYQIHLVVCSEPQDCQCVSRSSGFKCNKGIVSIFGLDPIPNYLPARQVGGNIVNRIRIVRNKRVTQQVLQQQVVVMVLLALMVSACMVVVNFLR